jgi:uncharacterized protein
LTTDSVIDVDYETLRDALARWGIVVALAELHGGVCGALCAGGPAAAERWLAECLEDQPPVLGGELEGPLRALVDSSWRILAGDALSFQPLLPDDDAPLEEQVQAFALWCHGFLGGIGASAPDVGGAPERGALAAGEEDHVAEILADFAEFSRAGLSGDEAAGREQPDFALAELVEYLRVSVQLVFEELDAHRAAVRDTH